MRRYPGALPDDAVAQLIAIADQVFAEAGDPQGDAGDVAAAFPCAARWFVGFERERARRHRAIHLEIRGERNLDAPGGAFTLRGVADRIDMLQDGGAAILDYKTGKPPSNKQVKELLAPQLPLEGAILAAGGFPASARVTAEELIYLQLSGGGEGGRAQPIADAPRSDRAKPAAQLTQRIAWFDDPATPYHSARAAVQRRQRRRLRPSGAGARMVAVRLEEEE